jgi:hypothetical protein
VARTPGGRRSRRAANGGWLTERRLERRRTERDAVGRRRRQRIYRWNTSWNGWHQYVCRQQRWRYARHFRQVLHGERDGAGSTAGSGGPGSGPIAGEDRRGEIDRQFDETFAVFDARMRKEQETISQERASRTGSAAAMRKVRARKAPGRCSGAGAGAGMEGEGTRAEGEGEATAW